MQVYPGSPTPALSSSLGLRQLNSTPQLALPAQLSATVLSSRPVPGAAALYQGELQLTLTNELLSYISASALPTGQALKLSANIDGSYQAQAVVATETNPAPTNNAINQALRDLLPLTRSGAFSQLLESLQIITQHADPALPDAARLNAQKLLESIPQVAASTAADAIQAWVDPQLQSLESQLARGQSPARGHPQQMLARLLQSLPLEPAPTQEQASALPEILIYARPQGHPGTPPASAEPAGAYAAAGAEHPPSATAAVLVAPEFAAVPAEDPGAALTQPAISSADTPPLQTLMHGEMVDHQLAPPTSAASSPPATPSSTLLALLPALRAQIGAALADQHLAQALVHLTHHGDSGLPASVQKLPVDGQQVLLLTSLPVQLHQQFHQVDLQIGQRPEQSPGQATQAGMTWIISLGFDLHNLGRIVVRGELSGRSLETTFWSEQASTRQLLEHRLPQLEDSLQGLGLSVTRLQNLAGPPPGIDKNLAAPQLVDLSV